MRFVYKNKSTHSPPNEPTQQKIHQEVEEATIPLKNKHCGASAVFIYAKISQIFKLQGFICRATF